MGTDIDVRYENIMVKGIHVGSDRLKLDEKVVKQLMESMREVGLLEPIIVCRAKSQMGVELVAGRNRLEAWKRLKHKDISARVVHGDTEEVRRWRQLAELDENMCRRHLSAAERAKITAAHKKLYVEMHPETAKGKAQGEGKKRWAKKVSQRQNVAEMPYTEATAKKTGRTKKSVERDVSRGEKLGDEVLDRVKGTSLDSGKQLDALAKLPEDEREELIVAAEEGEKVSAVGVDTGFTRLRRAWWDASVVERKAFVAEFEKDITKLMK